MKSVIFDWTWLHLANPSQIHWNKTEDRLIRNKFNQNLPMCEKLSFFKNWIQLVKFQGNINHVKT